MRLLCAHFPAFPLQVALRSRRGGAGALAVADSLVDPSGRREAPANAPLLAVSQAARKAGVRPGMTVAQARAACPDITVRPIDPAAHEVARIAIGEVMSGFGPIAEVEGGDPRVADCAAWVDVTGERRDEEALCALLTRELEAAGFIARVAAAGNRFTARAVAAYERTPERRIVEAGDEREALAPLPAAALPLDERAAESFRRLGLATLGDIARLPADTLARRFADSSRWSALARGEDPSPLVPFRIPPVLFEKIDLGAAVVDLEPLLFSLKTILDRVCARLTGRGASAAKLALHLVLEEGWMKAVPSATVDIRLPRPTVVAKTILEVARERLSRMQLPGPVVELAVEVVDALPTRRTQLELFGKAPPAPERVAVTLGRLATAFGSESVFAAALTDEHRPESAFRPEPFDQGAEPQERRSRKKQAKKKEALPDHAPPAVATPRAEGIDRPVRLLREPEDVSMSRHEIVVRGRRLGIVALVGPERLSGEWWESEFDRDYYRVHTEEGSRWWVYLDRTHESWHLHGLFD